MTDDDRNALQGVWQVATHGRLERHDSGPYAGLWLGPRLGSGVAQPLMDLLLARGLVIIAEQAVDDEHDGRVLRACAILTDAGRALATTPSKPLDPPPRRAGPLI